MKLKLSTLLFFAFAIGISQTTPKLPSGYKLATGADEETTYVFTGDFDLDGKKDFAGVITKNGKDNDGDKEILIILSSKKNTQSYYSKFPLDNDTYFFSFEKNVLTIETESSPTHFLYRETFKLKYYPQLSSMRLIGYDNFSAEGTSDSDMFSLSINLLTNKATKSAPGENLKSKKKITVSKAVKTSFPVIKLEDLNKKLFKTISNL